MNHPVDEKLARPESGQAGRPKTLLISVAILLVAAALIWLIFKTEPTASRDDAKRETAMLADVETVQRGNYTPGVAATGQVMPAQEVTLRPRVSGNVIEHADAFEPGSTARRGQRLLRIDPADYEAELQQARSEWQRARADLALEEGRQQVAREEYELLGDETKGGNPDLMLRRPQLEQAKADVASAEASVKLAELALSRTEISAPFDALVLERHVTVGSRVNAGDALARIVASDRYWVETTVPLSMLSWLDAGRDDDEPPSTASIHHNSWGDGAQRTGTLYRVIGTVDEQSRLARVLIRVEDPLALATDGPALVLGSYVNTEIEGRTLEGVVRLRREWVRRNDTVWVMQDEKLSIRESDILYTDRDYAYLKGGVEDGEKVVTSDLATVVEGAALRVDETASGDSGS